MFEIKYFLSGIALVIGAVVFHITVLFRLLIFDRIIEP